MFLVCMYAHVHMGLGVHVCAGECIHLVQHCTPLIPRCGLAGGMEVSFCGYTEIYINVLVPLGAYII